MRRVEITRALNGFIVVVGCQTLVFNNESEMIRELKRYIDNPMEVEKEYLVAYGRSNTSDPPAMAEEAFTPIQAAQERATTRAYDARSTYPGHPVRG